MTKDEIILNFDKSHLKEIYFGNRKRNYFIGNYIKPDFITLLIFLVIWITALLYSYFENKSYTFPIITFIILILFLLKYFSRLYVLLKERNSINKFITNNQGYSNQKIILTENTFCLVQDDRETITRWSAFQEIVIELDYIMLMGTTEYIFPKKAMSVLDFEKLKSIARTRINSNYNVTED